MDGDMSFFEANNAQDLLAEARELFIDARNEQWELMERMDDDMRFAAGEQWDERAKAVLEAENRPALTFNLTQQVIREFVGANEDVRKRMRAVPVGDEDQALAGMMDHMWQRVYHEGNVADIEREAFEKAITCGLNTCFIDVNPSEEHPGFWDISLESLGQQEVIWDASTRRPDYSDAKYVCWTRWVRESDFKRDYPERASEWEELQEQSMATTGGISALDGKRMDLVRSIVIHPEQNDLKEDKDFFKRDERLMRIVHIEYVETVEKFEVFDREQDENGQPVGWTEVPRAAFREVERSGLGQVRREFKKEYRWLEFTGREILFDDVQPVPIDRFALIPMVAFMDWSSHKPFGVVHPLKDGQREVNKRYSYELDNVLRQAQPGAVIEHDAVDDIQTFQKQTRSIGGTAVVKKGVLVEGRYVERTPPALPTAAADLGERAFANFNRVAGLMLDPLIADRSTEEPVGTALLRHRRSLMAITPVLENFRRFQREVLKAVMKLISRVLPDAQILQILGDPERYSARAGAIADLKLETIVPIRDVRAARWQVESQAHADDTTGQVMLLQTLVSASQSGIPIDPMILVEFLPLPGDMKARARTFIEQQMEQQQQTQQQEQQLAAQAQQTQGQQVENLLATERMKVMQKADEAEKDTATSQTKMALDFIAKMSQSTINATDQEKGRNLELAISLAQAAQAAQQAQAPTAPEGESNGTTA